MLIRFVGLVGVILTLAVIIIELPTDALALNITIRKGSMEATIDLGQGGPFTTDTMLIFASEITEISGTCKNPQGLSETAKGKPYGLRGFVVKSADSSSYIQQSNGHITVNLSTSNPEIQRAFDISQYLAGKQFINLQTSSAACPNPQWTWDGFGVTKANAVITYAKVPSFTTKDLGLPGPPIVLDSGTARYNMTNCQNIQVPDLDTNGDGILDKNDTGMYVTNPDGSIKLVTVETCDFAGKPFTYCSRFESTAGPDGNFADSGLRIYWYDDPSSTHTGEMVSSVADKDYNIRECYLFRDVNKLSAYNLSSIGGVSYTYDPDTANLLSPQQGTKDVGGLVLKSPYLTYTGECHQHGNEVGGNGTTYNWNQQGPQKKICDASNNLTVDPICTGGSQLLDGNYNWSCP